MKTSLFLLKMTMVSLFAALPFCGGALEVPPCSQPPVIDGKLDDAAWKNAGRVEDFAPIGAFAGGCHVGKAAITADSGWIYVGFQVKHPEAERLALRYSNHHDDLVQREDCVKFAFAPEGSADEWYLFKLSRGNVRQERRVSLAGHELQWNIPWRSAVHEDERGWTAEIAIPRCLLPPFDSPEKATANFYLTIRRAVRDAQAVVTGEQTEHYSAAPQNVYGTFEPQSFMPLTGLEKIELTAPFLPLLTGQKTGQYYLRDGKYCYDLNITLKRYTARKGRLQLEVVEDTVAGKRSVLRKNVMFPPTGNTLAVTIPVPAQNMTKRTVSIVLNVAGEDWQKVTLSTTDQDALALFSAYLDRNYYTDEPTAYAICGIRLPSEAMANLTMRALVGKKVLAEGPAAAKFPIALDKLPAGVHDITLKLHSPSGEEMAETRMVLTKRPPNPGNEYKIDHERRCILDNGKPFFPFALCLQRPWLFSAEMMKKYRELGFNSVFIFFDGITPEDTEKLLVDAEAAGLRVILVPEPVTLKTPPPLLKKHGGSVMSLLHLKYALCREPLNKLSRETKNAIFMEYYEALRPGILQILDLAKKYNNIAAWYILDEPVDRFDMDIVGRRYYRDVLLADGYRPTMVLYSSRIPEGKRWIDWFDVLGTDPYWIPGLPSARGSINYVSRITRMTELRAAENRMPSFQIPMSSFWTATKNRTISEAEQRAQTYLIAIHGCGGIMYFSAINMLAPSQWEVTGALAREFQVLGPACLEKPVAQNIVYTSAGKKIPCVPENGKFTDIQASLKRDPEGGYILIAANSRHYPVKTAVTIKGATGAEPLFDGRGLTMKNGRFFENFEPFGTRAWRISGTLDEPVEMQIAMTPPAVPPPGDKDCDRYRSGVKNVLQNPSFEQNSVPHWPDFFRTHCTAAPNGGWIGEEEQFWGTDDTTAKFGKYSLMLKTPATKSGQTGRVYWLGGPESSRPEQYVFSFYAKADHPGAVLSVELRAFENGKKLFKLSGTDWQRFELPVTVPARLPQNSYNMIFLHTEGKAWIDGIQLEKGQKATVFSE